MAEEAGPHQIAPDWTPLGGAPAGVNAVSADRVGSRLDVYVRDGSGALWHVDLTHERSGSRAGGTR